MVIIILGCGFDFDGIRDKWVFRVSDDVYASLIAAICFFDRHESETSFAIVMPLLFFNLTMMSLISWSPDNVSF